MIFQWLTWALELQAEGETPLRVDGLPHPCLAQFRVLARIPTTSHDHDQQAS
jgi:hypothetical protein